MIIFRDTITIFNTIPQRGREPERLQRYVVRHVFWDGSAGAGYSKLGKAPEDSVEVIIPYCAEYMLPARWADAGYPTDSFTLQPGDVIVRGAVTDENITPAELLKKYGSECCIIATAVRNCCHGSRPLWHWEIEGK